ncbi:MAG: CAP domain-containing protein [Conexivisphaera sp.]|uniref:CAP domain-containing protein n=1 Tax=Thermogutta sp. TaxID=1962930 RepID=UPI00321F9221
MSVELDLVIYGKLLMLRAYAYDDKKIGQYIVGEFGDPLEMPIIVGHGLYIEVKYIEDYDTYLAVRDLLRGACLRAFGRSPVIYPITTSNVLMAYLEGVDDVDKFHLSLEKMYEKNKEKLAKPIPNPRPLERWERWESPRSESRDHSAQWRSHRRRRRIGRKEILVAIFIAILFVIVSMAIMGSNYTQMQTPPASTVANQTPSTSTFTSSFAPASTAVNQTWVSDFMAIVNQYRANESAPPLAYSAYLASFSEIRFHTMTAGNNYEISHYGFDQDFNSYFSGQSISVGEVVFYPSGETPSQFVGTLMDDAPLHWKLLMDPEFTQYGYFIGEGNTVLAEGFGAGSSSTVEIPGPNINITQFIIDQGYTPVVQNATWLVIDLAS